MGTAPLRGGTKKRWKTVELIVEEHGWDPAVSAPAADQMRWVRVAGGEVELRRQVKAAASAAGLGVTVRSDRGVRADRTARGRAGKPLRVKTWRNHACHYI